MNMTPFNYNIFLTVDTSSCSLINNTAYLFLHTSGMQLDRLGKLGSFFDPSDTLIRQQSMYVQFGSGHLFLSVNT